MSTRSKSRALEIYVSDRICHMFLISKYRGHWHLGLCTFWVLAKRELPCYVKFRFFLRARHAFFRKSPQRCGSFFASTKKVHRPRSRSPLHFDITPVAGSIFRPLFQTHLSKSEFKNGHISRFCSVFQVIQVIWLAKFFSAEEVDLSFNSWIWIHESDFKGFFLEKRLWKSFSIKCRIRG